MHDLDPMECPECGEHAVRQPPADLVPWESHGMTTQEWSHKDGSSLCPVVGPSGGYEPAQPRPAGECAPPEIPDTTRVPVHIAEAVSEWARTQNPARLAGWADGSRHAEPEPPAPGQPELEAGA